MKNLIKYVIENNAKKSEKNMTGCWKNMGFQDLPSGKDS